MANYIWQRPATDGNFRAAANWPQSGIAEAGDDSIQALGAGARDFELPGGYSAYTGDLACFYPGTRIATPSGAVAVETLEAGDLVLTADGRAMKVRWAGRSHASTRLADPLRCLPIRIRAGALAEGVPARDLLVSPDHALFLHGVLVQAGGLVNGSTIIREPSVPEIFIYHHIELASHELLLAEAALAESFMDHGGQMNASNVNGREPPCVTIREMAYPRARSARQLPLAVRRQIAARAERLVMS